MLLKYCYLSTAFYSFQHVHQLIRWMRTLMIRYLQLVCKRVKPNQPKILFDWAAGITDNNLSHSAFFETLFVLLCLLWFFVSCGTDRICFINELLWSRTNLLVPPTDTCMVQRREWLPVHSQQCIWELLLVHSRLWRRCTFLIGNQIWPLVRCECNDNSVCGNWWNNPVVKWPLVLCWLPNLHMKILDGFASEHQAICLVSFSMWFSMECKYCVAPVNLMKPLLLQWNLCTVTIPSSMMIIFRLTKISQYSTRVSGRRRSRQVELVQLNLGRMLTAKITVPSCHVLNLPLLC